jgi:hypothetical protein
VACSTSTLPPFVFGVLVAIHRPNGVRLRTIFSDRRPRMKRGFLAWRALTTSARDAPTISTEDDGALGEHLCQIGRATIA